MTAGPERQHAEADVVAAAVAEAGRTGARLDRAAFRAQLGRRRRARRLQQVAAGGLVVVVLALGLQVGLSGRPVTVDLAGPADVDLRRDTTVAFDAVADVAGNPGVPTIAGGDLDRQPTVMLAGFRRCGGPAVDLDGLVATTYCSDADERTLILASGTHQALPERGEVVPVALRGGFVLRENGALLVTVSDNNSLDDRHHRLVVQPAAGTSVDVLAAVLASIPDVAAAPPPASPVPSVGS